MEDEDQDQYEREGEEEEGANRRLTLPTGDAIGPRARSRTPPCRTRSPLFEGRSGVCCYSRGMQRGQDIVMSEPARTCRVSPGNKVARLTVKMRKGGNVRPLLRNVCPAVLCERSARLLPFPLCTHFLRDSALSSRA